MDGANMNAQVGLTSPGTIGADVCHRLHKTNLLHSAWWRGPGHGADLCGKASGAIFARTLGNRQKDRATEQKGSGTIIARSQRHPLAWRSDPADFLRLYCHDGRRWLNRGDKGGNSQRQLYCSPPRPRFPVLYKGKMGEWRTNALSICDR